MRLPPATVGLPPLLAMTLLQQAQRSVLPSQDLLLLRTAIRAFTLNAWAAALLAALFALLVIGGTTAIFENDFFRRMTPVRPQDYVFWLLSALLVGLLAGTFVVSRAAEHAGKTVAGGFFADIAVGCPVCNKIVVAAIGSSGALTFFGPLQLFIGIGSIGLLAMALVLRARAIARVCAVPRPSCSWNRRRIPITHAGSGGLSNPGVVALPYPIQQVITETSRVKA